jgi:hypothetical protein
MTSVTNIQKSDRRTGKSNMPIGFGLIFFYARQQFFTALTGAGKGSGSVTNTLKNNGNITNILKS